MERLSEPGLDERTHTPNGWQGRPTDIPSSSVGRLCYPWEKLEFTSLSNNPIHMPPASDSETLYAQLGGHEGILEFIRPFYMDVRQHEILGPIFNAHIKDWDIHLAKIADFWALQTGGPSSYRGGFAGAHLRIGIQPEFFDHWLKLWDFNCQRQLTPDRAAKMSAIAHELGRRLKNVILRQP